MLQVVDKIEKGHLTYKQSQKKYSIQGRSIVYVWLRKHDNLDWKIKLPMKNKKPPKSQISELEKIQLINISMFVKVLFVLFEQFNNVYCIV